MPRPVVRPTADRPADDVTSREAPVRRRGALAATAAGVVTVAAVGLAGCATTDAVAPQADTARAEREPIDQEVVELDHPVITLADIDAPETDSGTIVGDVSWRDRLGTHRVLLVEIAGDDTAPARVALLARHYRVGAAEPLVVVGEVRTEPEPCGDADLVDRFYPETLSVDDADGDGVGEASFLYATGCITDVVGTVTAMMFSDEHYSVSGARMLPGHGAASGEPGELGEPSQVDPRLDGALRSALVGLWEAQLRPEGEAEPTALVLEVDHHAHGPLDGDVTAARAARAATASAAPLQEPLGTSGQPSREPVRQA